MPKAFDTGGITISHDPTLSIYTNLHTGGELDMAAIFLEAIEQGIEWAIEFIGDLFGIDVSGWVDAINTFVDNWTGIFGDFNVFEPTFNPIQGIISLMEFAGELIVDLSSAIMTSIFSYLTKGSESSPYGMLHWVTKLPLIGDLAEVFTGIEDGDLNDIGTWVNSIAQFINDILVSLFGESNILSFILTNVIPGLDASKITTGQFVQGMIEGLTDFVADVFQFVDDVLVFFFGEGNWLSNILASIIPGLDTSKITTGTFGQSMIDGLSSALDGLGTGINTALGGLGDLLYDLWHSPFDVIANIISAMIPGLDATKIVSGLFGFDMIDGLVDTFNTINGWVQDLIDGLIGALRGIPIIGGFVADIVDGIRDFFDGLFGVTTPQPTVQAAAVPALDGSKIQTGEVAASRIAALDAAKVTTGTLATDRVPNLPADKITTGTLDTDRIPQLAQDKIDGLATSLANLVGATSDNLCGDPTIANSDYWQNLGADASLDTAVKRSGTQSLKIVAPVGTMYTVVLVLRDPLSGEAVPSNVLAGQRFRFECYVKGDAGNVGTNTAYMTVTASDSSGGLSADTQNLKNFTPDTSDWGHVSCEYIIPAGYDRIKFGIGWYGTAYDGNTMWVEDITVLNVSAITDLIDTIVGGLDGTGLTLDDLADAVGNIPGGNIASQILSSIVPPLDATKITSGQFPQSQITDLSTDLAAKLPSELFLAKSAGGRNLATDPTCSNPSAWVGNDSGAFVTVTSDQAHSGTKCVEFTPSTGTGYPTVGFLRNAQGTALGDGALSVRAGDKFFMSCWVREKSGNADDGVNQMYIQAWSTDSTGALGYSFLNSAIVTPSTDGWTQITHTFTIPAGRDQLRVMLGLYPVDRPIGEVFYVDDLVLLDISDTAEINQALYQANSPASTVVSAAVPNLDATKIATGTLGTSRIPQLAQSKIDGLSTSLSNLVAVTTSGNLCGDPTIAIGDYWASALNANWSLDASVKRSGAQSLKGTAEGGVVRSIDLLRSTETGGNAPVKVSAGQRFRLEFYAKGAPGNTAGVHAYLQLHASDSQGVATASNLHFTSFRPDDSDWTHYSGEGVFPSNGCDQLRCLIGWNVGANAGDQMWIEDITVTNISQVTDIIETIVDGLDGSGLTLSDLADAVGNIPGGNIASEILSSIVPNLDATKISSGVLGTGQIPALAQSKVTGLEADLGSKVPGSTWANALYAGGNLLPNGGFEDEDFFYNTTITQSSEYARSGTYSGKIVGNGDYQYPKLLTSNVSSSLRLEVTSGQSFYFSAWFYCPTSNTLDPESSMEIGSLGLWMYNDANVYQDNRRVYVRANEIGEGAWVQRSGILTVPDNVNIVRAQPLMYVNNSFATGNVVYVDDVVLREVTEAVQTNQALYEQDSPDGTVVPNAVPNLDASKIDSGEMSQSRVTGLPSGLSEATSFGLRALEGGANLLPGGSFDDTALDSYRDDISGSSVWALASDRSHSGTRSLKAVGTGGAANLVTTPTMRYSGYFPVTEGQVFYVAAWVYADAGNTVNPAVQLRIRVNNVAGASLGGFANTFASQPVKGTWTKIEGYVGPVPATGVEARLIYGEFTTTVGDTHWMDDLELREVTSINQINQKLYGADEAADAILSQAVPNIDASKIDSGTLGTGVIPNLDAGKVTSGTLGDARIPTLGQSKVSGLETDLSVINNGLDTVRIKGSNIVSCGTMEDGSLYYQYGGQRSSEQAHSGNYSYKWIGNVTSTLHLIFDQNAVRRAPVSPNDVFYCEFWIRGHTNNIQTAAGGFEASLRGRAYDGNGTGGTTFYGPSIALGTGLNGSWERAAGFLTFNSWADMVDADFYIAIINENATEVYYIDDVSIYRASEAVQTNQALYEQDSPASTVVSSVVPNIDASKIDSGTLGTGVIPNLDAGKVTSGTLGTSRIPTLAQSKVTSLEADLAARLTGQKFDKFIAGGKNLLPNPGFESTDYMVSFPDRADFSTEQKRTGTYSLKMTAVPGNDTYFWMTTNATSHVNVSMTEGQSFYLEFYVYGKAGNDTASGGDVRLGFWFYDNNGTYVGYDRAYIDANAIGTGSWVKVSGIVPVLAGQNVASGRVALYMPQAVTDNNVYYVDDCRMVDVSEVTATNQALYDQDSPDDTILTSAVPGGLEATKITSGQFGTAQIPNLDAGKVTSGTLGTSRIPTLAQSKVTSLESDLAAKLTSASSLNADKLTTGTVDGGRIPTLDQSKIDGLPSDLDDLNTGITSVSSSAGNMVVSPNFEDTSVDRYVYSGSTAAYSTEQKFQGTYSYKWDVVATGWRGVFLAPHGVHYFAVKEGDSVRASVRIKAKSGNSNTGYMHLFMRWMTAVSTPYTDTNNGDSYTITNSALNTDGGWVELVNYGVCPADRDTLTVFIVNDPTTPTGNAYYLDAVSVRDDTQAAAVRDTIGQGWYNDSETGRDQDQIYDALRESKRGQDEISSGIATLQSEQKAGASGGVAYSVNVAEYGAIPSVFTRVYNGSGSVEYNSSDGGVLRYSNDTGYEFWCHNDGDLFTDYQEVSMLVTKQIGTWLNYGSRSLYFIARRSGNSALIARLNYDQLTFGHTTSLSSGGFTALAGPYTVDFGSYMTFRAGLSTAGTTPSRVMQFLVNGVVKKEVVLGSVCDDYDGNRGWGWGMRNDSSLLGNYSGYVSTFYANDNEKAVVPGSGARLINTDDTTQYDLNTGYNLMPNNFWTNTDYSSPDIDCNLTTGQFTVTEGGWYYITAAVKTGDIDDPRIVGLILYIDGSYTSAGTASGNWQDPNTETAITGNWMMPLAAGTTVKLGASSLLLSAIDVFTGDDYGSACYFTIAKVGVSG